jgi:ADP-ribosyl-[dinitrogen reductase] hydrolase
VSPRTSASNSLQIATIVAGDTMGAIGVTFCPGKKDIDAARGAWDRDLAADLYAIADWNAAAVVTLMEDHELASLAVEELGQAVQAHHLTWFHLPIRDVDIPGEHFEEGWRHDGEAIRALVRAGANVVLHCRGGLGRSGMIAARLLTELGWAPDKAIAAIRHVRPGAIETRSQEQVVMAARPIPPRPVDRSPKAVADRARGCLLGLALGDALGTTLEFAARDAHPKVTDLVGGGPFGLKPGQWTDDTAMALALAESLQDADGLDERGPPRSQGAVLLRKRTRSIVRKSKHVTLRSDLVQIRCDHRRSKNMHVPKGPDGRRSTW